MDNVFDVGNLIEFFNGETGVVEKMDGSYVMINKGCYGCEWIHSVGGFYRIKSINGTTV